MTTITIKVKGLDKVQKNLAKLGSDFPRYIRGANIEVANHILDTQGLRNYPPATKANFPPPPYYIRGRGMQGKSRNDMRSQRLGTRWTIKHTGPTKLEIGNPVTYAKWVHGQEQARHMKRIGWKKLVEVAKEKIPTITSIYEKWIAKLIHKYQL